MKMFRYPNNKMITGLTIGLVLLFSFSYKKTGLGTESGCDVKGIYKGTSTGNTGVVNSMFYVFMENNFTKGGNSSNGLDVTFGGYRNTCDSIFLSVFYTENSCYYLLEGKLSNKTNTIDGIYKNLTTPSDTGTFTLNKADADKCDRPNF